MEMPIEERPRERLLMVGVRRLKDAEVLAIIIGSGGRGRSSLELARSLLKKFGGAAGLSIASVDELQEAEGVGQALAMRLAASMELARRSQRGLQRRRPQRALSSAPGDAG
ncbi:hypothetical protein GCM10027402_19430 [Arthrobacter monumenti]